MNFPAFFSYLFLTAFSPGPNNIMAMSNSAQVGFLRGLRFNVGVFLGFLIDMSLCACFTTLLFRVVPAALPVMKWVGAAYILFLAYSIVKDKPSTAREKSVLQPGSMLSGVVLQFVNIKVILYGITALSTFVLPVTQSPVHLVAAVMVLSLTGFAGTCCWSLFGALFQKAFSEHRKLLNGVMATLLVYCAVVSVL